MAYTINANAKNVWIRDNEDTRDLSIQTDASSVYLDNGRTLEQELGEGSMVSNVATVDSAMSKVIDGTLDGAYESLVFKGKSLVNLASEKTKSFTTSHFLRCTLSHELVNGKKYLLKWDITNNTIGAFDVRFLRTSDGVRSGAFTLNVPKVVTVTNDGFDAIEFFTNASSISQGLTATIDNIMVVEYVEGMENNISYFEGLCDSKMPVLTTTGSNMVNPTDIEVIGCNSYDVDSDGIINVVGDTTGYWARSYIRYAHHLKGNTTYYIYCDGDSTGTIIAEGWVDNINSGKISWNNFYKYTPETDVLYGVKIFLNTDASPFTCSKIRIGIFETTTKPSSFEPYKSNILRTSEEIVLREVNGVQDTYNPLTGEYVKRIGEVVLNGNQALSFDGSLVYLALTDRPINNSGIADKMPVITVNQLITGESGICIQDRETSGRIYINIEGLTTREEVVQYLQTNPITIQYVLAEPVTTIVKPSTMTPFAYQNGHVILESGYEGQSLLPTLEYSTVVNKTGQVEGVAKVIQKQEKQLTMLEQMLIQNIIGLDYNNTVLALNLEINEVM